MTKNSENYQTKDIDKAIDIWEKQNIISDEVKDEMETMWEIPQICHFFYETKDILNLPHISIYEVERMLLIPKASKLLSQIMTCLLSSPNMRTKLRKIPPMPYKLWTNILLHKCKNWFRVYQNKHQDRSKVLEAVGIEPAFWKIFPNLSILENSNFEDLNLKQKVWLVKTVCDTIMHSRKTVQDEIIKHSDENQIEMVLGTDRYGATYIYFPQFLNSDIRIYRHHMRNKIVSVVKFPAESQESIADELTTHDCIPSLLTTQTKVTKSHSSLKHNIAANDNSKHFSPEDLNYEVTQVQISGKSLVKPEKSKRKSYWKNGLLPHVLRKRNKRRKDKMKNKVKTALLIQRDNHLNSHSNHSNKINDNAHTNEKEFNCFSNYVLKESSKSQSNETNDLDVIYSTIESMLSKVEQESGVFENTQSHNIFKRNVENVSDSSNCNRSLLGKVDEKQPKKVSFDNKMDELPMKAMTDFWNTSELRSNYLLHKKHVFNKLNSKEIYEKYFTKKDVKENKEYWKTDTISINKILDDLYPSTFDLVADSVESLRDLIATFSFNDDIDEADDDMYKIISEKLLIKTLCELAKSLEEKEDILKDSAKRARLKLQQELLDFKNGIINNGTWIDENGITMSWWILGSQNCSLLHTNESSIIHSDKSDGKQEKLLTKWKKHTKFKSGKDSNIPRVHSLLKNDKDTEGNNELSDEDHDSEEGQMRTTRVLRARGISSYTGQFYSDEDSNDEDLEKWPEVNLNLFNIDSQNVISNVDKKPDNSDKDSDQEWILPKKRRKKNKRQSVTRKLKTFQNKIQVIHSDVSETINLQSECTTATDQGCQKNSQTIKKTFGNTFIPTCKKTKSAMYNSNYKSMKNSDVMESIHSMEQADSIHSKLHISSEKIVLDTTTANIQCRNVPVVTPTAVENIATSPPYPIDQQPLKHVDSQSSSEQIHYKPQLVNKTPQKRIVVQRHAPNTQNVIIQQQEFNLRQKEFDGHSTKIKTTQKLLSQKLKTADSLREHPALTKGVVQNTTMKNINHSNMSRNLGIQDVQSKPSPHGCRMNNHSLSDTSNITEQKTTSLIVLSDSDDEIEMIVIEKSVTTSVVTATTTTTSTVTRTTFAQKEKPVITSEITVGAWKNVLPSQMVRRMNQGGISITPLKPQVTMNKSASPQVVVVVNETGSHYALALPNGSKLILTPEQVAQIRASNGGKLSLEG